MSPQQGEKSLPTVTGQRLTLRQAIMSQAPSKSFARNRVLPIGSLSESTLPKNREEVDAFFKLINWCYVDPLIESGRGKTERDGGFRSGGFTVERWVYSDEDNNVDGNSTEEGYRR
jgi:hypothetical protein